MAADRLFNKDQGDELIEVLEQIRDGYSRVDDAMSSTSENPVQNKVIYGELASVNSTLANEVETRSLNGAHNLLPTFTTEYYNGITYTVDKDGVITVSGTPTAYSGAVWHDIPLPKGKYVLSGASNVVGMRWEGVILFTGNTRTGTQVHEFSINSNNDYTFDTSSYEYDYARVVLARIANNTAVSGKVYPMLRLASDPDDTYHPYAMTNQQLTENKGDKSDLTDIDITGSTNNTGSTIAQGTFFYLNGSLVKALADIANGATFTSGTNYNVVTVGGLNEINKGLATLKSFFYLDSSKFQNVTVNYRKNGNIVMIAFNNKASTSIPANTEIGTVPNTIKPDINMFFATATGGTTVWIDTDGKVHCPELNTNNWLYATCTYIL